MVFVLPLFAQNSADLPSVTGHVLRKICVYNSSFESHTSSLELVGQIHIVFVPKHISINVYITAFKEHTIMSVGINLTVTLEHECMLTIGITKR